MALLVAIPSWEAGVSVAGEVAADLSVSLATRPDGVSVGNDGVVVATVRNHGPDGAFDTSLTLTLPPGLVPATAHPSRGSCSGPTSCQLGSLLPDESAKVRLVVTPVGPGIHEVLAEVSTATVDPRPENDVAEDGLRAVGRACDAVGTQHRDEIHLGAGQTVACGLRGDDRIGGDRGAEMLIGGSGQDVLSGGRGDDDLIGGQGDDAVSFRSAGPVRVDLGRRRARGDGHDALRSIEDVVGSRYRDVLEGSREDNDLRALAGHDVVAGGADKDRLLGGRGADSLVGDRGNDLIAGGPAVDGCVQGLGSGRKRGCERLGFALAHGLALFEPASSVVGYGYHESLFGTAVSMRPLGRLARSAHPGFSPPPQTDGPRYVVMDTRNRPTGPTTAVDVVVPSRARVRSPVTGRVVTVERYRLYCEDLDWKIVLRPLAAPDARVLVLHLATPRVDPGDDVAAGSSVLGIARDNDASSAQENLYFPDGYPHVHIEVERDGASPTPGCAA